MTFPLFFPGGDQELSDDPEAGDGGEAERDQRGGGHHHQGRRLPGAQGAGPADHHQGDFVKCV